MTAIVSEKDGTNNKGIIFERDFSKEIQIYIDGDKPSNPTYHKTLRHFKKFFPLLKNQKLIVWLDTLGMVARINNDRYKLRVQRFTIYTGNKTAVRRGRILSSKRMV